MFAEDKRQRRSPMKPVSLFILLSLFFINCGSHGPGISSKKFEIAVSILPQKYFVERIAGDGTNIDFDIHVMIPPGHSPATYAPTPRQMRALSHCKLYFRIGYIPFETIWMKNIAANNPQMKIIDTSEGVDLIKAPADVDDLHQDHHHAGIDPHIWLSPPAVKIQVKHILDAFIEIDRESQESYKENYRLFLLDIDRLDREIRSLLEECKERKFMVFHPAWSYLARDYGLEQLAIEEEGKAPNPANLKKVIDITRRENIRIIFVQQQFDTHSASAVAAEIGGRVVRIDPLAPDWLDNMKKIAQTFGDVLK
jgi:zinc transport system substrate-binding protein